MEKNRTAFRDILKDFSILYPYFSQNRLPLTIGLLSLLLVDLLQLVVPLIIKRTVDHLATGTATASTLLFYGAAILGLALTIGVFRYIWRMGIFGISRKIEMGLRNEMFARLQTLSPSFFQKTVTGDLMARAVNDINAIRMASGMGLVALVDATVLGMAAVGFMLSINVSLTLISLIPAPFIVVLGRILTRRMSTGFERVQQTFSNLTERVREGFAGIRVIKANSLEQWQLKRVEGEGKRYIAENLSLAKTMAFFFPVVAIFTNLGLAIVIWMGGRLTIAGNITPGDLVAFTSYLNIMTWPIMAMGWVANLLQRGGASLRRIRGILDQQPEITERENAVAPGRTNGEIRAERLSFRYEGQKQDTLEGINFKILPGETVAFVGRVGSGKSTLLRMLPRLLPVQPGVLFLDGYDVTDLSLSGLRKSMGFVPQDVFIFSDTIRNNLLMGREGITEDRLKEALDTAGIWEEFQAYEKGLDTLVGERGITLSGGQRQRLTIARAVLEDPPVLILDDALSMVDSRTEERILTRILKNRTGRTTLIVTHRTATLRSVDRVIVLDEGKIAEEGDHYSLLSKGRLYGAIYESRLLEAELELGEI